MTMCDGACHTPHFSLVSSVPLIQESTELLDVATLSVRCCDALNGDGLAAIN